MPDVTYGAPGGPGEGAGRRRRRTSGWLARALLVACGACLSSCTTDMRPFLELRDLSFERERGHLAVIAGEWRLRGVVANRHESLTAKRVVVELQLFDAPDGAPVRSETEIVVHTLEAGKEAPFWRAVALVPSGGYVRWEARVIEARSPIF